MLLALHDVELGIVEGDVPILQVFKTVADALQVREKPFAVIHTLHGFVAWDGFKLQLDAIAALRDYDGA
jgi:hypothetical protein